MFGHSFSIKGEAHIPSYLRSRVPYDTGYRPKIVLCMVFSLVQVLYIFFYLSPTANEGLIEIRCVLLFKRNKYLPFVYF